MNAISRQILKSLLNKPAPDRIPRSGEKALSVDCNVVYFRSLDKSWTLLCDQVLPEGVSGKYWANDDEFERVSIPFYLMSDYELDITHFYGRHDLRYGSIAQYFWEGIVPVDKTKILIGKGSQFLFNKKELVRSERIEVLKIILEKELDQRQYVISSLKLSSLLCTEKWVFHPDKSRQLRYNDLLLRSLHESHDLEETQYGFRLSSKALVTIAQYEEDQKKHRENISQARSMKWLTVALIFVGLIQLLITFLGQNA